MTGLPRAASRPADMNLRAADFFDAQQDGFVSASAAR
jgi:hypothetical protein